MDGREQVDVFYAKAIELRGRCEAKTRPARADAAAPRELRQPLQP
jgi:hypothetical protein